MTSFRPTVVDRTNTPPVAPATSAPTPTPTPTGFGGSQSPTPGPGSDVVAPVIQPPPAAPPAPLGGDASFLELNAQALEQALAALEAQYGLSKEQLLASRTAIGDEYRLLAAQAERARGQALEQTTQSAQERGIVRSGIHAEAVADTELAFAEQLAGLESSFTSGQEQIDSQLLALEQQLEFDRLAAERAAQQRALDQEVMQLLLEAGL